MPRRVDDATLFTDGFLPYEMVVDRYRLRQFSLQDLVILRRLPGVFDTGSLFIRIDEGDGDIITGVKVGGYRESEKVRQILGGDVTKSIVEGEDLKVLYSALSGEAPLVQNGLGGRFS